MNINSTDEFLECIYQESMFLVGSNDIIKSSLSLNEKNILDIILKHSESSKAVLTVLFTSIIYKILNPWQDIRNHQISIDNGYSGRTFDHNHITPFMKSKKFPAMAESGWLTRSLEQKVPYSMQYTGAIKPEQLKQSFLTILDKIQNDADAKEYILYIVQGLIIQRNKHSIELAKPTSLQIANILDLIEKHFNHKYQSDGVARLPVLAIYAAYKSLIPELKRFEGKRLLPIESHTSSDARSGRVGDIELQNERKWAFEAVEIKYGIPITLQIVQDAYEKFNKTPIERYYILSTTKSSSDDIAAIETEISRIKNIHGCQLIVNGVMETLKYYLRLLSNPYEFIENYVSLLKDDKALKFEHKEKWNKLIGDM
jgi:DNA (cytosine-5)-methyltransferase 1